MEIRDRTTQRLQPLERDEAGTCLGGDRASIDVGELRYRLVCVCVCVCDWVGEETW